MTLSLLLLLPLSTSAPAGGVTLAVPGDFPTIQAAIDAAQPGDTVLVADGVYRGTGNRDVHFGGKAITVRSENGPQHCTIDCEGTPTVPFRGFVFDAAETRDSVLEGFTITGGATLPGAIADIFNGGGILIQAASPTIRNCHFVENQAGCWGGAVYVGDSHDFAPGPASPLIENCTFEANLADDEGGGFFTWGFGHGSQPTIRNSVFLGNGAATGGGAVTSFGGTELVLDHVTMIGNSALIAPNAWIGQATVTNSILWNEDEAGLVEWSTNTFSYSLVKGGVPGIGNLDVDPLFKPDGYHLRPISPLVDAGSPASVAGQLDIDGQPRRIGRRSDIGADEAILRGIRR